MITTRRLLCEAARCVLAGPSLGSMYRRLAFAPLRLWLTNPRRALLFVAVRPYTMLPYKRLAKLAELADECNRLNIPGAFVQCGVWKGGSAAVLESIAVEDRLVRSVWLLDSFAGCPEPGAYDVSMYGRKGQVGEAMADSHELARLLYGLGLKVLREGLHVSIGWFENTVPSVARQLPGIALLHLDADWYESTYLCMERFYPFLWPGGYVVVDDFGHWMGAQRAVSDYFNARGIPLPKVTWIDHTCVWWRVQ